MDPVEGRFPFDRRANFDEVPLAFVPGNNYTFETKGSKTATIVQPGGASASKRIGTLVVGCFGDGTLIPPTMIFRGTGERISAVERAAHHEGVTVLWQKKAWMDTPTQLAYAENVLDPAFAERGLTVKRKDAREGLLFMDNLAAHRHQDFTSWCKKRGVLCWFHSPGDTDVEQVVDAGSLGALIKRRYDRAQDTWLDVEANLVRWEDDALLLSERRTLVTHWVAEAYASLTPSCIIKGFEKTGCLMTADSTNDNKVCVAGVDKYEFASALKASSKSTKGPRASAADAVGSGESEGASSGDEAAPRGIDSDSGDSDDAMDTLAACVLSGKHVQVAAPAVAVMPLAMVGRQVVMKWSTGWALGTVTCCKPNNLSLPFEVQYEDGLWPQRLSMEQYSGVEDAPSGSWAFVV